MEGCLRISGSLDRQCVRFCCWSCVGIYVRLSILFKYRISFYFSSYWLSLIEIEAPEIFPLLFDHDVGHLAFAISIGICFAAVSLWCFYLCKWVSRKDCGTESNLSKSIFHSRSVLTPFNDYDCSLILPQKNFRIS